MLNDMQVSVANGSWRLPAEACIDTTERNTMGKNNTTNITAEEALEFLRERLSHLRKRTDFFDTLFKSMGGYAIIASDFDGNILTCNEEVIKYYGYMHEEIIGREMNIDVFFPKDFIETEKLQQAIKNAIANGTYVFEEENVRRDGSVFPAQIVLALVKSKDGTMFGFIMIVQDVTERKRWEMEIKKLNEALERRVIERTAQLDDTVKKLEAEILVRKQAEVEIKKSEEILSIITASAGDAVMMIDDNGIVTFWNKASEKIFGYTAGEALGKNIHRLIAPEKYYHDFAKGFKTFVETGKGAVIGKVLELEAKRKDGTEFYTEHSISAVKIKGKWCAIGLARDVTERKEAEKKLCQSYEKLRRTLEGIASALSSALEMRDAYTAGHGRRVTMLSCAIAREMGISAEQTEGIRIAGILHDIGKISIPAEILSKPGKLSKLEYELIKSHANAGYEILKDIEFPWPIAQIVLQHHETLDGSGYPSGLSGDKILKEARMLCVADVVEAMASHRPYRAALGIDVAIEEVTQKRGILYDPVVVDACVRLFKEKGFTFK